MASEQYETGLTIRKEVLGEEYVDAALAKAEEAEAALKAETTETVVAGWTTLGLLELQRKRDRVALREVI